MACDPIALSAYLDEELPQDKRRQLRAHLEHCSTCARELARLERTWTALATLQEQPDIHEALMRRAASEVPKRPLWRKTASIFFHPATLAAAAAILVGVATWSLLNNREGPVDVANVAVPETSPEPSADPFIETPESPKAEYAPEVFSLRLLATSQGVNPLAIMAVGVEEKLGAFAPGDTIVPGVDVLKVNLDSVVLGQDGDQVVLFVSEDGLSGEGGTVDGLWAISQWAEGRRFPLSMEAFVEMKAVRGRLSLASLEPGLRGNGRLEGRHVTISMTESGRRDTETAGPWEGDFDETFTTLSLVREAKEVQRDGNIFTLPLRQMQFVRLSDQQARARRQIGAYKAEVEAMLAVLMSYKRDHDNTFPDTLAALSAPYAEDPDFFADTENRRIAYDSQRNLEEIYRRVQEIPRFEEFSFPDRLMASEQALQATWGNYFLKRPPILRVTYAQPAAVIAVTSNRRVNVREASVEFRDSSAEAQQAVNASCQNNMKQLGIIIRMFENENKEFVPPGWHYVYPEYLTNPKVLTCPADEPGTMNYEILFPATHHDYLKEVVSAVTGEPIENLARTWQALLPLIVETHEHRLSQPGRNVAFADGHVEFIRSYELNRRIGPYLNYR